MKNRSLFARIFVTIAVLIVLGQASLLIVVLSSGSDPLAALRSRTAISAAIVSLLSCGLLFYLFTGIRQHFRNINDLAREAISKENGLVLTMPEWIESRDTVELINSLTAQLKQRIQRESEQLTQEKAILSSMIEGVLAIDSNRRIINMNGAAADLLQITVNKALGRRIEEVVRISELLRFIQRIFDEKNPIVKDLKLYEDKERYLRAQGSRLISGNGEEIGALVVLFDVTRMHQLEMIRKEFAANVSHELRTPITGIKGFVETLLDGQLQKPEELERYLTIIAQQTDRLAAIIDDLLDLARVEQDIERDNITRIETFIRPLIDSAVSTYAAPAKSKNISVVINCDENLKAEINPHLLEQAFGNLIDNAVKYSDSDGKIEIGAHKVEEEIVVSVTDHGRGIEERHLSRLFERFYRVDKARSRELGGTGLGLAIVKHIALSHHGRAEVTSTPGKGSTFTIRFPSGI